jgi:glyoxylase-like metal-dependent hydrolase (beta-lactamase superfamily II)
MIVHGLVLGDFQTNCYIVQSWQQAGSPVVIDPGMDPDPLMAFFKNHQCEPIAILLTHGHIDHIAGVSAILDTYPDIKVYVHPLDADMFTNADLNLSILTGVRLKVRPAGYFMEEGQTITLADMMFKVIHTPGHTPGGICLYIEDEHMLFSGDTLFAGSIGRTDFPGGSMDKLLEGIREKLFVLPDQTIVYPGHGPQTTIGHEKQHNPFLA